MCKAWSFLEPRTWRQSYWLGSLRKQLSYYNPRSLLQWCYMKLLAHLTIALVYRDSDAFLTFENACLGRSLHIRYWRTVQGERDSQDPFMPRPFAQLDVSTGPVGFFNCAHMARKISDEFQANGRPLSSALHRIPLQRATQRKGTLKFIRRLLTIPHLSTIECTI